MTPPGHLQPPARLRRNAQDAKPGAAKSAA